MPSHPDDADSLLEDNFQLQDYRETLMSRQRMLLVTHTPHPCADTISMDADWSHRRRVVTTTPKR